MITVTIILLLGVFLRYTCYSKFANKSYFDQCEYIVKCFGYSIDKKMIKLMIELMFNSWCTHGKLIISVQMFEIGKKIF